MPDEEERLVTKPPSLVSPKLILVLVSSSWLSDFLYVLLIWHFISGPWSQNLELIKIWSGSHLIACTQDVGIQGMDGNEEGKSCIIHPPYPSLSDHYTDGCYLGFFFFFLNQHMVPRTWHFQILISAILWGLRQQLLRNEVSGDRVEPQCLTMTKVQVYQPSSLTEASHG